MNIKFLHKDFKWNGNSFSSEENLFQYVDHDFPEISIFIREWFNDQGLIHCRTSGSTGKPKTIGLERRHMINSAMATGQYFDLGPGSSALLCLPLAFIAGKMMLIRAMVLGWHLHSIEPSSTPRIPKNIHYDFSAMVPLQLHNSLNNLNGISTLIVGGGEVSSFLKSRIENLSTKIFATYGMTETITHVALKPLNKLAGFTEENDVFSGLPGISFSKDSRQCLCIQAPAVSEEEVVTNDIVELMSDTQFKWIGRYDNIINSGGLKLIPELIEHKFKALIKERFFIAAIQDQVLGEKLILIVEGDKEDNMLKKLNDFQNLHSEEILRYEVPKMIFFANKFVQTETGKLRRKATMDLVLSTK